MRTANPNVLGSFVHGAVFRYATYFLLVLIIVSVSVVAVFKAEADVAIFHSDTYVEKGVEIANEDDGEKYIQYESSWSDFKGTIPEGTFVNNITLHFSWSLVTRSVVEVVAEVPEEHVEDPVSNEGVYTETPVIEAPLTNEVIEEVLTNEIADVPEESDEEREVSEGSTNNGEPEAVALPITESEPSSEPIPPPVDLPEVNVVVPVPEESIEVGNPSETEGFETVSLSQLFPLANAQLEGPLLVSEDDTAEVIIAESISTTSGFVASDLVTASSSSDFFEVRYTTDGVTWYELERVGFDGSQEMSIDLPAVSLDVLSNLQVAVHYAIHAERGIKIIFNTMQLVVDYDVLPVEEVIEPIGIDDRIPNFEVSSVRADIQSENIRAVMLERGGMLEFWYSVTAQNTNEITWYRLVGGSVIDPDAPIAIKERTIFWLDRNQQTLFGFSVDDESLFSVPFVDPEEKIFLLPFKSEDNKPWEAVYNAEHNTLEFNKVSNKSS